MKSKLHNKIEKDKLQIRCVDMSNSKYEGMNYYANKELKTEFKMKPNTIIVDKKLKGKHKSHTIHHEIIERGLMKKGMRYKNADKIATKNE